MFLLKLEELRLSLAAEYKRDEINTNAFSQLSEQLDDIEETYSDIKDR